MHCYYNTAGFTRHVADVAYTPSGSGILYAKFNQSSSGTSFHSVGVVYDVSSLNSLQNNSAYYVVPLYLVENGTITVDLRNAPQLQVFER